MSKHALCVQVAARTQTAPRTVKRYLDRQPVRPAIARAIRAALAELGVADPTLDQPPTPLAVTFTPPFRA